MGKAISKTLHTPSATTTSSQIFTENNSTVSTVLSTTSSQLERGIADPTTSSSTLATQTQNQDSLNAFFDDLDDSEDNPNTNTSTDISSAHKNLQNVFGPHCNVTINNLSIVYNSK